MPIAFLFENEYITPYFPRCINIAECYKLGMFSDPYYLSVLPGYYPMFLELMLHGY